MKKDNPIDAFLNIESNDIIDVEFKEIAVQSSEVAVEVALSNEENSIKETDDPVKQYVADIDYARSNIKEIIRRGSDSLLDIIDLAKQSENPRAYEVASTLMKSLLDANKQLVDTTEKKTKTNKEKDTNLNVENLTQNNLLLSTTEVLKMLKGEKI